MTFQTSRDYLRGALRMLKDDRDEAFDLLRLALTEPRFDTEPVERIRAQMASRLAPREHDTVIARKPARSGDWRFLITLTANRPTAPSKARRRSRPAISTTTGVALAKDTLKIAVVGDIDAAALGKLLDLRLRQAAG